MEKKRIMVVITKDEERITKYFNSRILCDIWCIWKMITGWSGRLNDSKNFHGHTEVW